MFFDAPPESGKKSDVNGGRKLASDLTPQQREARLDYLSSIYNHPLNEGEEPFDEDGLKIDPHMEGVYGPRFASPQGAPPQEEAPSEEGLFSVDEIQFVDDPSAEGVMRWSDYLNS